MAGGRWLDERRRARLAPLGLDADDLASLEACLEAVRSDQLTGAAQGDPVLSLRGSALLQCEAIGRLVKASGRRGREASASSWRCVKALDELCGLSLDGGWIREADSHWADRDPAAHALYNDMPRLALLLIDRGASVDAQMHDGEPLLIWFARNCAGMLLDFMDRAPDLNARGPEGGSFLHHLGCLDLFDCERPLGLYRAAIAKAKGQKMDLNVRDHEGRSPLHWAAQTGDLALAQALVEAGADPLALSSASLAPWEESNGEPIAQYLEAAALAAREAKELGEQEWQSLRAAGKAALALMGAGRLEVAGVKISSLKELLEAAGAHASGSSGKAKRL